ncbi:MAG: DUF4215 domain-containing protein [bacterium]
MYEGHIDCHFKDDARRTFLMDDRGGQGVAYGFTIDPEPGNPSAWDYCPHCSLAVMVADVGIDFDELEILGISPDDVLTTAQLITTLEALAAEDPEQLARDLRPNLEGQDLFGFIDEVQRIIGRVQPIVARLRSLQSVTSLDFDFESVDFDELTADIGLRLDSAYRGDFDNPNDPRRNNSGVATYTLRELIMAMATQNVPEAVRSQVESLLSAIPGLPGTFEISGKPDDALAPVQFHGIKTNLTVKARSYVVSGQSAALVVFTLVNDTRRLLPLAQVAMISDFDMPPLSRDTSTEFDPARFAVMVYDNDPVREPVYHYWFASAPAINAAPGAGVFVPLFYNLDKNLSLSQSAPSIETNRMKFFLGHPDVVGDHDDAEGKSEKQGAISLVLGGPLMPGDQRTVAFCWAAGKAESDAASKVAMLATLDACRGLYALLTPACGNGQLQLGEACDDGNTADGDGCSADCEREICGDGEQVGAEACDDGNTDADDGCGPTCEVERCGDGIVQAGEACDDGNDVQTDGCLNDCTLARCGDGHVRVCDPAVEDCGGCLGQPFCLAGEFDVISSSGSTRALDGALNQHIVVRVGFDIAARAGNELTTGPVVVQFRGDEELETVVAPLLTGQPWTFTLAGDGPVDVTSSSLSGSNRSDTYTFALSGLAARRRGGDGLDGLDFANATFTLQRFAPRTREPTDTATGAGPAAFEGQSAAGAAAEVCDDGNGSNFDGCTNACERPRCGDGFVQLGAGEACDVQAAWCAGCQLVDAELCGNGMVEAAQGEECDDGGRADGDGCSALCRTERCGDGVVQGDEGCDDGNDVAGDGCNPACALEFCGDGVVQAGEECDDGALDVDGACRPGCVAARCGDGVVQSGVEACDDGNAEGGDGCSPTCEVERCGDGLAGPGEACDDGNDVAGDGCTACQVDACGDGRPGPGETCDDGNAADGDGCSKACQLENPDACGDGNVGRGEACDDGNTVPGDGCDATCRLENPDACGNGVRDAGEACDDGNTLPGDGCSATCAVEGCGDGIQQPGEGCDDGDREAGDGCDADCRLEPATCGNGVQEVGEQCDDGNAVPDDGCDDCRHAASIPELNQTCGNGVLDVGEQCDDGGRAEGDGCDVLCQLEATVCGNGVLERGEDCDPGVAAGDRQGCGEDCRFAGVCGDGLLQVGEQCDDGGNAAGDGCDAQCHLEGAPAPDAGPRDAGAGTPGPAPAATGARRSATARRGRWRLLRVRRHRRAGGRRGAGAAHAGPRAAASAALITPPRPARGHAL